MIDWLTDTLVMTGALMALVLLVRRPVARWFGSQAAYALWLLPLVRLVMPPLALPAALAPTHWLSRLQLGVEQTSASAGEVAPVTTPAAVSSAETAAVPFANVAARVEPAVTSHGAADLFAQISWSMAMLVVWLGGALVFLGWRTWNYQMMRRQILADARPVALAGKVRIVESPLAGAPLAFGVFDKVVALPLGFLASADSESSDFAVAHELEHHAGSDLLIIMAMQPLFALHWFNPLGWAAWRAMRSDQEAACDARVVAGCGRDQRARYGQLIASFAGNGQLTLGAPMAGGLSGDKPIIQRLKALRQGDIAPWRKVAARSLFAMAIVSVPMTATVSYAALEAGEQEAPAPEAIPEPPEAPTPPAPAAAPQAPAAPPAPPAPVPPVADAVPQPPAPPAPPTPPVAGNARVKVMRIETLKDSARGAEQHARHAEKLAREAGFSAKEIERMVEMALSHAPQVQEFVSEDGKVQTIRIMHKNAEGAQTVSREMVIDSRCPADTHKAGKDKVHVVVCTGAPEHTAHYALSALQGARAGIAAQQGMDAKVRAEVLADLDREIAEARREIARD